MAVKSDDGVLARHLAEVDSANLDLPVPNLGDAVIWAFRRLLLTTTSIAAESPTTKSRCKRRGRNADVERDERPNPHDIVVTIVDAVDKLRRQGAHFLTAVLLPEQETAEIYRSVEPLAQICRMASEASETILSAMPAGVVGRFIVVKGMRRRRLASLRDTLTG